MELIFVLQVVIEIEYKNTDGLCFFIDCLDARKLCILIIVNRRHVPLHQSLSLLTYTHFNSNFLCDVTKKQHFYMSAVWVQLIAGMLTRTIMDDGRAHLYKWPLGAKNA